MTARLNTAFHPTNFIERLSSERQALWLIYAMNNRIATSGIYITLEYDDVARALGYQDHVNVQYIHEVKSAVLMMAELLGQEYVADVLAKHPKTFVTASVLLLREWGEVASQQAFANTVDHDQLVQDYVLRMASVCYQWDNTREGTFDEGAWTQGAHTVLEELNLPQVLELRIRDAVRNYCEAARPIEETALA